MNLPPTALIIGASSGIGAALAREFARNGLRLALVARRQDLLEGLARELNTVEVRCYAHDVTHYDEAPGLWQQILQDFGRVDIVVYNAGVMVPVGPEDYDFGVDRRMVEVNVLGAMAWLNPVALTFSRGGRGQIVGISSVAGDRGRVGAPGYNTTKAALSTYLEALRNRLTRRGVRVLTVKPGFVQTDMLKGAAKTFWVISPEQAAKDIVQAIRHRAQVIYTPARWGLVMSVIRHIPSVVFRKLKI
jgi:decaprenylphospho-beta-D-erythro-pentofuranosid-2-ulose 2-reductase